MPIAGSVAACIDLYEGLIRGTWREPLGVTAAEGDRYDVRVGPRRKDRLLNSDRTDILRVQGPPSRHDPYSTPGGIIAVLGAGNVSSSFEMIRALFVDGYTVVHKPHHVNERTDRVWEKVLEPLVRVRALAFCPPADGHDLTRDPRLSKIYFTGGTPGAKAIMQATDTELVSECGGNNPCLIVPGDRPWTDREIHYQALEIATMVKINGGAQCGRTQTRVRARNWPQRRQFLDTLVTVLRDETPATTTWYPGVAKTFAAFQEAYPEALLIKSRDQGADSDVLYIEDAGTEGFALTNEAFCQVVSEVALDAPASATPFLEAAVDFCNNELLGTLAATILVDESTRKAHGLDVDQAVTRLRYGAVGVNTMPPLIWASPYLTWGGNERGGEFASGIGNFGNVLGYDNVEKSIVFSSFTSPGALIIKNKRSWLELANRFSRYTVAPTWRRFLALAATATRARSRRADF